MHYAIKVLDDKFKRLWFREFDVASDEAAIAYATGLVNENQKDVHFVDLFEIYDTHGARKYRYRYENGELIVHR